MHSCEYASVITQSGQLGTPPGKSGASRPENRVHERSNPPHQKCDGLDFPMNLERNSFSTRSACTRICQYRCAAPASYVECFLSSVNRSVSAISIGTGWIFTSIPRERRIDMYSS